MNSFELVGYYRSLEKKPKELRMEGYLPAVLYGKKRKANIHFSVPMILMRDIVYTSDIYKVALNIEGDPFSTIIKEIVFHPVSEIMMHADFLELYDDVPITIEVPIRFKGTSPGIQVGGKLSTKLRKIRVKALVSQIPSYIDVDISKMELGASVKIKDIDVGNLQVLNSPLVTIASILIPRTLRSSTSTEEESTSLAE